MNTVKVFLSFLSVVIFGLSYWYNFQFEEKTHPNDPYVAKLMLDEDQRRNNYVVLEELKNDAALISVNQMGTYLLTSGETQRVEGAGSAFFGSNFEGKIKVESIQNGKAVVNVNIHRAKGFYWYYGFLLAVISTFISGAFYGFFYFLIKATIVVFEKAKGWNTHEV